MSALVSANIASARRAAISGISAVLITLNWVAAQEVEIHAFELPQPLELAPPEWPSPRALGQLSEGYVVLRFMVDTDGSTFDPLVVESVGHEAFQDASIAALLDSRFEPATLNGEAIVGSQKMIYPFKLPPELSDRATQEFSDAYRRFEVAFERGERESIERALARLERQGIRTLYEHVYTSLARYKHAVLFASEPEQLLHLGDSLYLSASPEGQEYLGEEVIKQLRRAKFSLEVRNNYFGEAIATFKVIEGSGDADGADIFADIVDRLETLRLDDTEYFIPLDLGEYGQKSFRLFKRNFAMIGGNGRLNEAVLRCDRHHAAFPVERDTSYNIPLDWGECWIEITGDARANFSLLQH